MFKQLKTDFAVAPVFLKDVGRIEALFCVYYLVLLAESLLERELRQAMEREGLKTIPLYPEGRPCRRPTARRLIDVFEPVTASHPGRRGGPVAHPDAETVAPPSQTSPPPGSTRSTL